MDNEESHTHGKDHRYHSQTVQCSQNKTDRTSQLTEDSQPQRNTAAYAQRIGENGRQLGIISPFLKAMRQHQAAEQDTQRQ